MLYGTWYSLRVGLVPVVIILSKNVSFFLGSHFFYNLTIVFINNYVWLIWLVMIYFFALYNYNSDNKFITEQNRTVQDREHNTAQSTIYYNIFYN